jgi:hypothetical protein
MDLQEQVTALEAEKKQYLSMIDNINAEKIALDNMLLNSLKESLGQRKDNIIKDQFIKNLNEQIELLNQEKENLIKELTEIKEKFALVASEAQY